MQLLLSRNALFLLPMLLLAACGGKHIAEPFPIAQMSPIAPPAPLVEEVVRPQDPTEEVWRPGFWSFDGRGFTWIPGNIMVRPDPTAIWSRDRWEMRGYGWAFIPGYWQ